MACKTTSWHSTNFPHDNSEITDLALEQKILSNINYLSKDNQTCEDT